MKTGLGKKEQARRTRKRIIEQAIKLFARGGFAQTSTQKLAKAIGMTPGVLYWHFESKEDLLAAVLDHLLGLLFEDLTHVGAKLDWSDPATTLETMIERVARVAEGHQDYLQLVSRIAAEATDTNPRIEEAVRAAFRRLAAIMESLLLRAYERGYGYQPPMADVQCAAQMFMGLYMGGVLHQRLFRRELPLSRSIPVLRRMLYAAALPADAAGAVKKPRPTKRRARR